MPSKKSKKPSTPKGSAKNTFTCSELSLEHQFAEFARGLVAGDVVFLEGEMGAGKSTFARAVLRAVGVDDSFQGSPTFAIAHEYRSRGGIVMSHVDLYRLKTEEELEDSGVLDALSSSERIVLIEWMSRFESVACAVVQAKKRAGHRVFRVDLARADDVQLRRVTITRL